jgi:cytochrome b561
MTTDISSAMGANVATRNATKTKRYHPVLVTLHWLVVILVFATVISRGGDGERRRNDGFQNSNNNGEALSSGIPAAANAPSAPSAATGFPAIGVHMALGLAVLAFVIVRLIVRLTSQHPEWATTGNRLLDKVGEKAHWALYFLLVTLTTSGFYQAVQRNQFARVFGFFGDPSALLVRLPRGSFSYGRMHGLFWGLLLLLILGHIGAALYHQFVIKDNLMSRMWYGKQTEE